MTDNTFIPIIIFILAFPCGLVLGFMAGLLWHDEIKDFREWQKEKRKHRTIKEPLISGSFEPDEYRKAVETAIKSD